MSGSSDGPESDILKLGIDATGVDAGAKKAEASLEGLKNAAAGAAVALDKVAPTAAKTGAAVNQVAPAATKTGAALSGLEAAATTAAAAVEKVAPAAGKAGAAAAKAGADAQAGAKGFDAWEKALEGISTPAAKAKTEAEALAAQFQATGLASAAGAQKMAQTHLQMEEARRKAIALGQGFYDLRMGPNGLEKVGGSAERTGGGLRDLGAGAQAATASVKLTARELQMLAPQLNDIFTQLSMGQGVMMTLMAQGPQIVQGFGGVGATLSRVVEVVGATRLAMLGLVAAGGIAIGVSQSQEAALATLSNRLRLTRDDYASLATTIDQSARRLAANSSLSTGDAREAGRIIASVPSFSGSQADLERTTLLAQRLAKAMGEDVPAGARRLAEALRDPAAAARRMADDGLRAMDHSMARSVERMQNMGDVAGAQQRVLDAYNSTLDRMAKTALGEAFDKLSQSFTRLWQAVRPVIDAIGGALSDALAWAVTKVSQLVSGLASAIELLQNNRLTQALGIAPTQPAAAPIQAQPAADRVNRAMGLVNQINPRLYQQQDISDRMGQIRAALPNANVEQAAAMRSALSSLGQQLAGLRDPMDEFLLGLERQAALSRTATGASRELAAAVQQADEVARQAGATQASDDDRARARIATQARLTAQLETHISALERETQEIIGPEGAVEAVLRHGHSIEQAEVALRAHREALNYGRLGTQEYAQAVIDLTLAYENQRAAQTDLQSLQSSAEGQRQIEMVRAEADMAGMLADQRERELAALRERQRIQRGGGDVNSDASQSAINTARQLADVRQQAQQTQNSWRALEQAGVGAFETIGNAITQALATGETRTIRLGDIWRAVMAQMVQAALRLAVINPIINAMTGGNLGTVGGLMGGGGGMGSAVSAAGALASGGAGGGGFGLGSLASLGGAMSNGWSAISGFFGGGAAAAASTSAFSSGSLGTAAFLGDLGVGGASEAALSGSIGTFGAPGTMGAAGGLSGIGGALAGIGGGFAIGSTLGGLLAGRSQARQTNAQIGAGIGAIGGFLIGGPIGGIIGGTIGGAAGGLIGPGPKTNAYGFAVDAKDGKFSTSGLRMTGTGAGGQEAMAEAEAALKRINEVMKEFGVTVRDGSRVINGQTDSEDQSKTLDSAAKVFRFQAEDQRVNTALADKSFESFDLFAKTIQEAKTLAEALDASRLSAFTKSVNELAKTYDKQIGVAQRLGFGEAELKDEREKQITKLFEARDKELAGARRTFEVMRLSADGRTQEAAAIEQEFSRMEAMDAMRLRLEGLGLSFKDVMIYLGAYSRALDAQAEAAQRALNEQRRSVGFALDARLAGQQAAMGGNAEAQFNVAVMVAAEQASVEMAGFVAQLKALGFSTDQITQKTAQLAQVHELEAQALRQQLDARKTAIAQGLDDRYFAATVDTGTRDGALAAYDRQAARERVAAAREGLADMVQLERVQAAERLKIVQQFSEQANEAVRQLGGGIRGFIDQLQATPSGGLGIPEQFTNAQAQFARDLELGRGGNQEALGRISNTAGTLLSAGQAMYASGPQFQALRSMILSSLEGLPAVQSYDALILAELQKLGQGIEVEVVADLTTTLRTLVEGTATLTADQRTILLANTETVQRTLALVVSGQTTGLTQAQRDIAQATGGEITSTLMLLVKGQTAGMSTAQRELAFAASNAATRTLSLLVEGATTLTAEQREIAFAANATLTRTLRLLVSGQVAGLTDAQRQIYLATTDIVTRTLSLLVTGQTAGLTDAQKDIALSSTAAFTRTLALAVSSSSMTSAQRALLLENTTPFARALELATTVTGGSATLRNALMNDIGTVARTLELAATGGTLTAEQQQIIATAGGNISRRLDLLATDATITPAQRSLIGVVNGEIRNLTVKQAVETTETVAISRSIDDKLSGILGAINRGLLSLIAVSQSGFASVAQSTAAGSYVSPGSALQASGLMPGSVSSNETFVSTLYNSILRRDPDPSGLAFYKGQLDAGSMTRAQVFDLLLRSNESWTKGYSNVGLEAGGWVGNGVWNRDSVVAAYAGGGNIALAGGEYVMRAPMAARYADVLPAMNAGAWSNDNGSKAQLAELRAMRAEMEAMRRQLASLQGETARGANAAEDTAATNRDMARGERLRRGPVGKVKGAA